MKQFGLLRAIWLSFFYLRFPVGALAEEPFAASPGVPTIV